MSLKQTSYLSQEDINILRLIRSDNIGPIKFNKLISIYSTATNALDNINQWQNKIGNNFKLSNLHQIEDEINSIHKFGAKIITLTNSNYPITFRNISDAPPALITYGNDHILNSNYSISIVGARNASAHGYRFAYNLAHSLGNNITIISGLARGIDTAAHNGCLDNNGNTIAVIGCGINMIYPEENKELYYKIKNRGVIITEMPFGTPPIAQNFPKRNRIISALCNAIVVIEAGLKSGSLITANFALEYNKDIFAVPGSPLDPRCKGSNQLIKQGAYLLEDANDIRNIIGDKINLSKSTDNILHSDTNIECKIASIDAKKEGFSSIKQEILQLLSVSPIDINEIILQTCLTVNQVLPILLELEMEGKIKRYLGNKVALSYHD